MERGAGTVSDRISLLFHGSGRILTVRSKESMKKHPESFSQVETCYRRKEKKTVHPP